MANLIPQLESTLPRVIEEADEDASRRVIEFFTAEIRNPNTRKAYARAVRRFFQWSARRGLDLSDIEPPHVAAYVEEDGRARATVKQNLAAIRRLFDYLVSGGALPSNPVAPVKGPKISNPEGKTPVLTAEETRELLDSIVASKADGEDVGRLRDRAVIATMTYTFARVSAVCNLDARDYFLVGHRRKLRLKEKGGKERTVPVHHKLEEYLSAYIEEAGLEEQKEEPLFQSLSRSRELTGRRLLPDNALQMVKRRAADAGFEPDEVTCHTFRGTGITTYLENGGELETAQHIAGHNSATTTKLYDRRQQNVEQEEIERIRI